MAISGPEASLISDLEAVVGAPNCLTEPDVTASFTTDWTGRFFGEASAVARPGNVDEVVGVLAAAARHGAAVVPQGGNTGLVGGSVPRSAGYFGASPRLQVVMNMRRLSEIRVVDPAGRLIDAGAGTTLAAAQRAAREAGYLLGIDLAARDSATLGGMVATNAGGMHVLRYGAMRSRVAGIEAVLADGTIVSQMKGLAKDNVGWDPAYLFSGSEGTLAVLTRVLMRLEPTPAHRVTALVALTDTAAAVDVVRGPLRMVGSLEAAELTLREGMGLVCERIGLAEPVGWEQGAGAWLTIEAASAEDPTDSLATALDHPAVLAVAVGPDAATRARLWAYRELHTEAVALLGTPHKLDVSVMSSQLPELAEALPDLVARVDPDARLFLWGHVADGNLHVNVVGPQATDYSIDDEVLRLVVSLGGSVSAEHGMGVAKAGWLHLARSPGSLDLMARVKRALDPQSILNPGVLEAR
ncbi:MAG: FAD-binding oxidoreductase [Acidimicrobiales bacterium]